jgi:gamma-glutamyltranspeptidase/glutathione hydrolase
MMRRLFYSAFSFALLAGAALAQSTPQLASILPKIPPARSLTGVNAMVVAQERTAARIGVEILDRGGNAVDAAVAVGFTLAVTYPRAGNIGGGGFMVIHLANRETGNKDIAIDYREAAPAAATPDMFLDAQGNPDPKKSRDSGLAVGVPGTVAGLVLAQKKYGSGKLSLAELLRPAIRLAEQGFRVEDDLADSMPSAAKRLARWPSTAGILLKNDDQPLRPGDRLIQFDLADTLRTIADKGADGFYQGEVAEKIVAAVRGAGGIMMADDLKNYKAIERPVVRGSYRGYDIVSMPPPSSGGVHLIEMLNILEGYDLGKLPREQALHLEIEAMKRVYADRAVYMGDPDQVKMPIAGLISKKYAATLRAGMTDKSTPAAQIHAGKPAETEGLNTTHFSVIDKDGNAVSNTYTLNFSYGLGLIADGTGVLLNNELDDFTAKPGASNAYGLVGFAANLPGPNKRPLSSMTPTIVLKDGKPFLITGSPGGSRIITAVLQVIANVIDFSMPIAQAVTAPRLHNQWQPDETYVEPGFDPALLDALKARGHKLVPTAPHTSTNSIEVVPKTQFTPRTYVGAADARTRGSLAAGY